MSIKVKVFLTSIAVNERRGNCKTRRIVSSTYWRSSEALKMYLIGKYFLNY